jgi:succinate-semialdehyde dehydrogenase/glutarate-semialdehyde dehydrogenase
MNYPLLINGEFVAGSRTVVLRDKYRGEPYGEVAIASREQVAAAVAGARAGFEAHRLLPSERAAILCKAADIILSRKAALEKLMTAEAGFTAPDGDNEVRRCVETLRLSAEEAKRLDGELVPMGAAPGLKDRMGFTIRVPRGVVCAITPFNSPLNTVAHKLGPALAGGNAVVLKPSALTPATAVELGRALVDAGLPPRLLAIVHGSGEEVGRQLIDDARIAYYTFTGSTRVGLEIQKGALLRGTQLELGSIASTIVCHDADIGRAVPKIVNAAFRKAGQVCTSVQKLYVDRRIAATFTDALLAATRALRVGDPSDPKTVIGPMISRAHAERALAWVEEARREGAEVLSGGTLEGSVMAPTVLRSVSASMRVVCEEIFAPVLSLIEFDDVAQACAGANDQPFGLAVGVFTSNLHTAFAAARALDFGGIHINEASSARVDVMPFGGVKQSGHGFEGPARAIREMTEERVVTIAY